MKGAIFAAIEALSLGGNVYLYWSRVRSHGDDPVTRSEVSSSIVAQQVLGGVFLTAMITGIVDAFVFP